MLLTTLQNDFIERSRSQSHVAAQRVPKDAPSFIAWFTALRHDGPGQGDHLFPWLASQASRDDMRWFIAQESAGELGFDDLVAMTQVRLPAGPKMEMARNYWDEMGRGSEEVMHSRLLERLVRHLNVTVDIDSTHWQSLALGNMMMGLASQRHYTYQAIGALGAIELTAPDRVVQVAAGLRRLGIPALERSYFEIHAVLDIKHAQAWSANIIAPLVERDPHVAVWIAEGALMRLAAGARCFDCYRRQLGVDQGMVVADAVG
jgi:hypothetical protein